MPEPMMDEAALRDMLERATAVEPPIGPVVGNAVRAGRCADAAGWRARPRSSPWPRRSS